MYVIENVYKFARLHSLSLTHSLATCATLSSSFSIHFEFLSVCFCFFVLPTTTKKNTLKQTRTHMHSYSIHTWTLL